MNGKRGREERLSGDRRRRRRSSLRRCRSLQEMISHRLSTFELKHGCRRRRAAWRGGIIIELGLLF